MENQFFATEFENVWKDWTAKQNNQGVIYYVNDTKQVTSWSHPYFKKVLEELDVRHNEVKYAAYRTSLKLKDLRYHIGLDWIQLAAVKQVFADRAAEADNYLSYSEALSVIQSVLHVSDKQNHKEEDIKIAADLILNIMMSLYDVNRSGKLLNRSVRFALVTMCSVRLGEKYRYFFAAVRDENQYVSREKLYNLLDDIMQFPYIVKEGESFGRNVAATCDSLFKVAGDSNNERISGEGFYSWLKLDPQTLVWLSTLHRILATETVQHNVSCSVCDAVQITGLRYRCLQCLKYELCQRCFLCGHTSLRHKLEHPIREYCLPTSVKDSTKALLAILKNKLGKRPKRPAKANYLPVNAFTEHSTLSDSQPGSIENNSTVYNSSSLDSGFAIGSLHEDVVISGQDSQLDTAEYEVAARNKTVGIIGEPCNTSSPFNGGSNQDLDALSKRDIEIQQQQMMLKIEQLQRENRMLQSKLNTIYKYCDAELTMQENDTEDYEVPRTLVSWSGEDSLKEMTSDVPISPIVHSIATVSNDVSTTKEHTEENYSSSSNNDQQIDIHHIIGTFTPVGSAQFSAPSLMNAYNQKSGQPEMLQNFIGQNDSSTQDGIEFESVALSTAVGSISNESNHEKPETVFVKTSLTESTLHNGMAYGLSDMSLNFQDTIEQSYISDESLLERSNSLQSQDYTQSSKYTNDLKLKNGSVISSNNSFKSNACSNLSFKLSSKRKNQQQPRLIFSSYSQNSKNDITKLGTGSFKLKVDSENVSDDEINPFGKKLCARRNGDDNCVELSEIFRHEPLLHSNEPTPVQMRTGLRRKTLEPVHMSTPLNECKQHLVSAQHVLKKNLAVALSKFSATNADKENICVSASKRISKHSHSESSIDKTPLSAISWHRKGILMSLNSLSNRSESSYNLTEQGSDSGNLSTVFRKAEHIGKKISEVASDIMDTRERDELEKIMIDFEKECIFNDTAQTEVCDSPRETSDGSMLAAVHNIGDALTNLVQAAEHCQ